MKTKIIYLLVALNIITFSFFGYIFVNSAKYDTIRYDNNTIAETLSYFRLNFIPQPTKAQQIKRRFLWKKN